MHTHLSLSHTHKTDPDEPENVAQAIHEWGLDYVVLTRYACMHACIR